MSGSLSAGRRRKKRRQRQRPDAGGEEDPLNLSLPLEVDVRESAWYPSDERSSKLDAAAAAAELSPDSRDDASQSEFLCVRAALEEQTDLGLHINEKGNQICQLSWADFSQRVPSHWTERHPNVCPLCKKKLSSRFSLSRHYIDVHHREEKKLPTPAPCRFCSKILYNQSTLNRHVLTVHKEEALALAAAVGTGRGAAAAPAAAPAADPSPPPAPLSTGYYCALCQQRHRRKSEVTRHMQLLKLQSPMGATRTGQAPKIQSPRAGRSSTAARQASAGAAEDSVSAEEGSSAPETSNGPLISPALTALSRELTTTAPFPCSVCSRTFSDQERLIAHLASHLRDNHSDSAPSGLCPLCELTVPQLASHVRDAHCRVCARCGLILPEALMERHLTAHDLKMAFWCPVCGQREDRRQKMMQHISERHEYIAEGSQFQCGSCGHVRSHNLVTHCLKHARDDALTAYWFKTDVLSPLEQRGLEAGRLLRSSSDDSSLQWLPVAAAEPAAAAVASGLSVHLLQACDGVPGAGLDAAALLSAALCPVCAAPTPSGRQLGAHLQRHGELPVLFCPSCPRTFCRPERARRHRCGRLLCLLCGLQVPSAVVAAHWTLHAGDDPICALLTPQTEPGDGEGSAESDEEPPCGLLERQLARQLAGIKQEPLDVEDGEDGMGEVPGEEEVEEGEDGGGVGEDGDSAAGSVVGDDGAADADGEGGENGDGDREEGGDGKDGSNEDANDRDVGTKTSEEVERRNENKEGSDGDGEHREEEDLDRDVERELDKEKDRDVERELDKGKELDPAEEREHSDREELAGGADKNTCASDGEKRDEPENGNPEANNGNGLENDGSLKANGAPPGSKESVEKPALTNGVAEEQNGHDGRQLRGRPRKRSLDECHKPSPKDGRESTESTAVDQNNVSDESSQSEKTPAEDPPKEWASLGFPAADAAEGDTPVREARSQRRSPPRKRRRSLSADGSAGGGSPSPGGRAEGRSPPATFRSEEGGAESPESDSESESLACDLCPRRLRSVSQLRRHRLYRHGEWRGPLRCPRCPRRFFLAAHRRLHACAGEDAAGGARPCCGRCGAEPAAGRPACLVSAAGRRLRLTVCARCDCPLPGPDSSGSDSSDRAGRDSQVSPPPSLPGAAVCCECDAPLAAGAAALLQEEGAAETPGPAAARLCVPCAEQRLAAEPRLAARLWRPEATLGALWCPSCCQPQVSLHQLRLHSLRQHADVM